MPRRKCLLCGEEHAIMSGKEGLYIESCIGVYKMIDWDSALVRCGCDIRND